MGSFGGYYKGDKKKPKKNKDGKVINTSMSSAPTFTMPEVIAKKKPSE